jgi:hypothetical protein
MRTNRNKVPQAQNIFLWLGWAGLRRQNAFVN